MPYLEVDWTSGKNDLGAFLTTWSQDITTALSAASIGDARAVAVSRTRLATTAAAEAGSPASPPHASVPARFADHIGVDLVNTSGGPLAAVLFVGADHKADSDGGLVFAFRVATRVSAGVGVVVVDIAPGPATWAMHLNTLVPVYPTARRPRGPGASILVIQPRSRDGVEHYDVWYHTVAVGESFPAVPLPGRGEMHMQIDLAETYTKACTSSRLP